MSPPLQVHLEARSGKVSVSLRKQIMASFPCLEGWILDPCKRFRFGFQVVWLARRAGGELVLISAYTDLGVGCGKLIFLASLQQELNFHMGGVCI